MPDGSLSVQSQVGWCLQLEDIGFDKTKHTLLLPECTCLTLSRTPGIGYLNIVAPKLQFLSLQACLHLIHLHLYPDKGPAVKVNLIQTCIDDDSLDHLTKHPRRVKTGLSNLSARW